MSHAVTRVTKIAIAATDTSSRSGRWLYLVNSRLQTARTQAVPVIEASRTAHGVKPCHCCAARRLES